jgi:hypothetical protein
MGDLPPTNPGVVDLKQRAKAWVDLLPDALVENRGKPDGKVWQFSCTNFVILRFEFVCKYLVHFFHPDSSRRNDVTFANGFGICQALKLNQYVA